MINASDFVIENGVLKKYVGPGGDVVIPEGVTEIAGNWAFGAFSECEKLTSVTIPEGVVKIGPNAFFSCMNLRSVKLPSSITSIELGAFRRCSNLIAINIPESLTTVGGVAFEGCENLSDLAIPDSVSLDHDRVFKGCKQLADSQGQIVVNSILFDHLCPVGQLQVSTDVTIIGNGAFENCTNLTEVILSAGITVVGDEAFGGCTNLIDIYFPESLTAIGCFAFKDCSNLQTLRLPANVKMIGGNQTDAFIQCGSMRSVQVDDENQQFCSVDGVLYDKNLNTLLYCPAAKETVIFPQQLTKIAESAFYDCNRLTHVSLPADVNDIGECAFQGCTALRQIHLPEGIQVINPDTFAGCSNLLEITLPESVTTISKHAFPETTAVFCNEALFSQLSAGTQKSTALAFLRNPDTLAESFSKKLVAYVKKRKAALLDEIIDTDDTQALTGYLRILKKLTDEELSAAIRRCSKQPGCSAMLLGLQDSKKATKQGEENTGTKTIAQWRKIYKFTVVEDKIKISGYKGEDATVKIPAMIGKNPVNKIAENAFANCSHIIDVILPDSVEEIGYLAFWGCNKLLSISIPATITTLDPSIFKDCVQLASIEISHENPRLKSVDGIVYSNDGKLLLCAPAKCGEVEIKEGVHIIEKMAFSGCNHITSIKLPQTVMTVAYGAFTGCSNLAQIAFPDGMSSIGIRSFDGCSALCHANIPASVTSIGAGAFLGCDKLTIHAPEGSYAETYAKENNIPFVAE